jgi:hypothetical protein
MKIFLLVIATIMWLITGTLVMSNKKVDRIHYALAWGTLVCLNIIELIGEII